LLLTPLFFHKRDQLIDARIGKNAIVDMGVDLLRHDARLETAFP